MSTNASLLSLHASSASPSGDNEVRQHVRRIVRELVKRVAAARKPQA